MLNPFKSLLSHAPADSKGRIIAVYLLLLIFNLGAWGWALIALHSHPLLMGTALLAYSFGLRHAVDPDHIAAIANVTRKMMQEGKRPVAVGLMFSLGHSSVVILASLVIAGSALALKQQMADFKEIGGLIGTLVSAFFLFIIAAINFVVLRSVYKTFKQVRQGKPYVEDDFNLLLADRGFLARIFRPMFRLITRSWHMYPLGFLFGLGFDTATEISLLSMSAAQASEGLSIWTILIFPVLFTAGMTLIDTTDSILMLNAYGWAFVKPIRKLYYNMTITFVSVIVAVIVGGLEVLGLLAERFNPTGAFWSVVANINEHFASIGYLIIAIFILSWLGSLLFYKWKRFDELEVIEQTRLP